ncbi:Bil1p Ecym_1484 [Eremothecium cymbalariae DBVPG|uniref:Uncharacterized protein n=1 Tax=Eremothecium cymbalariae (strain CBS 270.75 / DBVPG 7215 / KCTC 17166 / NRRL Y-17582) TaxID=931890 RepID=G8JMJ2_ERECY|nr:hypothetical protein Ecym_1484 [Eremothecium cymbalariae DBVPG\
MPTVDLSTVNSSSSANTQNGSEFTKNAEQVVTVFDLASEIEQSLNQALAQIEANESQFEKSLISIHERLSNLQQ